MNNGSGHYRILAFDLAHYLLLWQDPSVKELAEQIAKDPSFTNFAEQLQQVRQDGSMPQQVDYQKYMSAFQQVMQNPQFVTMAKKLGSAVMQVDPEGKLVKDHWRSRCRFTPTIYKLVYAYVDVDYVVSIAFLESPSMRRLTWMLGQ